MHFAEQVQYRDVDRNSYLSFCAIAAGATGAGVFLLFRLYNIIYAKLIAQEFKPRNLTRVFPDTSGASRISARTCALSGAVRLCGDVWLAGELEAAVPKFRPRVAVVGLAVCPRGMSFVEELTGHAVQSRIAD